MSLFSNLYIGSSGLKTEQNLLNATAHNLTNMDTKGYVRQNSLLAASTYLKVSADNIGVSQKQTGTGVEYAAMRQVRDYFLDSVYRRETGRGEFYRVGSEAMREVENLLGEFDGEEFQTSLQNLWNAVQEVSKDPASSVTQGLLVQRSTEFLNRSVSVYEDLSAYQDNLNNEVKKQVDQINDYAKRILELNTAIAKVECGGVEHANDLRDERNLVLDELSLLGDISFHEDLSTAIFVKFEGKDLVNGDMVFNIALKTDDATGFYTPYWEADAVMPYGETDPALLDISGAQLFDLTQLISSDSNTDIGGLKSSLIARGDHRADYTDITTYEDALNGLFPPDRTEEVIGNYNFVSQSVLMNVQAEFDQLVYNITQAVNGALRDARTNAMTVNAATDYMTDTDGVTTLQMFNKRTDEDNWNLHNTIVNPHLLREPSLLRFRLDDNSEDYHTVNALKEAFLKQDYALNPIVKRKTTLLGYYNDLMTQVGNSGNELNTIQKYQEETVNAADDKRRQVIGVSSDEELSNMIKFQNGFNASSRYINVISEMLDHIINALAR